jgi:Uma2 family endonuclease
MIQTRLTIDDLIAIPEDGIRRELENGELIALESSSVEHQTILGNIAYAVSIFLQTHKLGKAYFAPVDVVLEPHKVLIPDLVFVTTERLEIVKRKIEGAPDWVVEVLSDSTRKRDLHAKRDTYLKHGVRTYWAIDPESEEIRIWEDGNPAVILERGATLTVSSLPGFELSADEIFNLEM